MNSPRTKLAAAIAILLAVPALLIAQDEAAQLAMLHKPDATLAQKQDACRKLARIGTAKSIPVLAGLLGDPELSHMARLALEPIPDPSVDGALRNALVKVKGRPLLGVIGSVGVRGDEEAIPLVAKLLSDANPDVARAAARALGEIGTAEAATALQTKLKGAAPRQFQALAEGLFRCAESLAAENQTEQAQGIYDQLRRIPGAPHQIRAAALRGAVLTRGNDGLPLLVEALRDENYAVFASGIRISMELKGPELAPALASELTTLPADRQVLVIRILEQRGDPTSAAALMKLLDSAAMPVRIAALQALTRLNHLPVIPLLSRLSLGEDDALANAAKECLGSFPGQAADEAIAQLLASTDSGARRLGAELIGRRPTRLAVPALLGLCATEQDEAVHVAALKVLRELAGPDELAPLLQILLKTGSKAVIQATTPALVAVCSRQPASGNIQIRMATYGDVEGSKSADVTRKVAKSVQQGITAIEASNSNFGDPTPGLRKKLVVRYSVDAVDTIKTVAEGETLNLTSPTAPAAVVNPLVAAVGTATGPAKLALLRILRTVGGPKALDAVRTATSDPDAEVKKSARRMLCEWPTPDALPAVVQLAKNPPSPDLKASALRGWFRLIPLQDVPPGEKLAGVQQAMALADRKEEMWAALNVVGELPLPEALALVVPHLDDPNLKEEACVAAVGISEQIATDHPAEVNAAMRQVAKLTEDKRLAGQARRLAKATQGN